jgi:hypothetical protein
MIECHTWGIRISVKYANKKKGFKPHRLKPFSVLWAHQGMILGPPDYESGALTN